MEPARRLPIRPLEELPIRPLEEQLHQPIRSPVVPGCFEQPWAFLVRLDVLPCNVFIRSGDRATLYAVAGHAPGTLADRAANGATFLVRFGDMAALRRALVGALDKTLADTRLAPITRSRTACAIAAAINVPVLAGSHPSPEDLELVQETVQILTGILVSAPDEIWRICTIMQSDSRMHLHAVNVAVLSLVMARECGVTTMDSLQKIGLGGLRHDLGKLRLPRGLLDRAEPSPRDEQIIRTHPARGVDMLRDRSGNTAPFARIVGEHHERWDGTGYPNGLRAEAISFGGRLVAMVDGFEARTQETRPDGGATPFDALMEMRRDAGAYDDALLRQFVEVLGGRNLLRRRETA